MVVTRISRGSVVSDCVINGDASAFILSGAEALRETKAASIAETNTVSLSDWDGIFRRVSREEWVRLGVPQTVHDMAELFSIGRELSCVSSLSKFIDTLEARLTERFQPLAIWMARCGGDDNTLYFFPLTGPAAASPESAPRDAISRAVREQNAVAIRRGDGRKGGEPLAYIVPVSLRNEPIAVIALEVDTPLREIQAFADVDRGCGSG